MPLQLNDEEMSVLMSLAGPIDQQRRPQFLQEVAQELEVKRQAGEIAGLRLPSVTNLALFRHSVRRFGAKNLSGEARGRAPAKRRA